METKKNDQEEIQEELEEVEEVEEVIEEELSEVEALGKEIEDLKLALENEHNNFLKSHADLENTKKRIENDFRQRDKYKIQNFALSLLPAIDSMEKVLADNTDDNENLKEAMEMIYRQLMSSLEEEGVVEIEALDKPFDPNIHHAVMIEEVEGVESDIVLEVLQKGYMIKDRVLRASMVKVSQ